MPHYKSHRRAATVLSADVVGYSAMMAADDAATIESLLEHLRLIAVMVGLHGGRIVDTAGDNVLAEFPDDRRAFECAERIQHAIAARSRAAHGAGRMRFRIGLHSGELLEHGGRLYGDVVNVAARLQAAAEPEGILMSERVAERAGCDGCRERGALYFKNIPYPVPAVEAHPRG